MAVKKSELYSSIWASCDALRGGMDASEYKDYVLIMLFIKYISDKYAGVPYAPITVPPGASFQDMVALKGKKSIGEDINTKIIGPIEQANRSLGTIKVDFDNSEKLGSDKEKVDRLTNLIAIFEKPELDFSNNKAEGDDILGDAYEYLMRNFATESGKSKGQFYTPAEVSRIMAKIIGIHHENTSANTTIYDPTCGSGSLLLKVADEAERRITIYGQEKESATAGLARMNMVLHDCPTALIKCTGNSTLSDPQFKDEQSGGLKQFDFIVANPPFSSKNWSNGLKVGSESEDEYGRFEGFGIPPEKNGDFAFLLHMLKSLKRTGKAAVILPHGVLFRGNAEAEIRKNLIQRGYIKGIIGLPANLFYGTGIPACLIVLDKEHASSRKAIFMVDASKGFAKDGPKNRLRDQDIHKIVDVFNKQLELPKYSRIVPLQEIEEKEYNLNIPRYIDSQAATDLQDIAAHLQGGLPDADIAALQDYWEVYGGLKEVLFAPLRTGYQQLRISKEAIKSTIFAHPAFGAFQAEVEGVFGEWQGRSLVACSAISSATKPKQFIHNLAEDLLGTFSALRLIDKYDVYQQLMTYWSETLQDDVYLIVAEGWKAGNVVEWDKKRKHFEGKLIPKALVVQRFFAEEQAEIDNLEVDRDALALQIEEMEEEHGGDEGLMADARNDKDKVTAASVKARLKVIKGDKSAKEERELLEAYLTLTEELGEANRKVREAEAQLAQKVLAQYSRLSEAEVKALVVDDKWMATLAGAVRTEMQRISQRLTQRIRELAERYETPVPAMVDAVAALEAKVKGHLERMGFVWK